MSGWPEDDPFDDMDEYDPDYVPGDGDEEDDFAEYADDAAELWAADADEDDDYIIEADLEDLDELDDDGLGFGFTARIPGTYVTHTRIDHDEEDEEEEEEDEDEEAEEEEEEEEDPYDDDQTYDYTPVRLLELAALINSASNMPVDHRTTLLRRLMRQTHISGGPQRRRQPRRWWKVQTEPDPRGLALLRSGEFGPVGPWAYSAPPPPKTESEDTRVRGKTRWQADSDEESKSPKDGTKAPAKKRRKRPSERHYLQHLPRNFMYAHASRDSKHPRIPNTSGTIVARYPSVPYVGQFCGPNDSIFYSATQYFTLHMYSTQSWGGRTVQAEPDRRPRRNGRGSANVLSSLVHFDDDSDDDDEYMRWGGAPPARAPREETSLSRIKTVQGIEGQWTITDADADRAGRRMIYSSITPHVYMMSTEPGEDEQHLLDFQDRSRRYGFESFGLWSIRFSADGQEVVAGASRGNIMVYDINSDRRTLCVQGHRDDVNAVCFADESSTNILVSGSDDGYVKIWDRRSLNASQTPSGVLVGATEGITFTAPKGDGRYILANSKDQACRLYDLRKMRSWHEFADEPDAVQEYGKPGYDYRHGGYQSPEYASHPRDCSIMTYRGHSVERTLIRCHFSPAATTGQSYVFSGSSDGKIHIWSLDGRVVQVLDRALSQPLRHPGADNYTDPSAPEPPPSSTMEDPYYDTRQRVVRDVAWHSQEPTLMSTCWDMNAGYRRGGSIAKHEWKGLGKNGLIKLEDWVEKDALEASI